MACLSTRPGRGCATTCSRCGTPSLRSAARTSSTHDGPYYKLSLLPDQWRPPSHDFGDIKIDVSAVGPWMTEMAGEVADGVHVHPLHSVRYLEQRLIPAVRKGAERAGRALDDVDLLIPVFIVPGDTPEEREPLARRARTQIGFYGSTRNYAFQFDDLGFDGTSAVLNDRLKAGDLEGLASTITDEMLDVFAIVGRWDEIADRIVERYLGVAERVISYLTVEDITRYPDRLARWGEIARGAQRVNEGSQRFRRPKPFAPRANGEQVSSPSNCDPSAACSTPCSWGSQLEASAGCRLSREAGRSWGSSRVNPREKRARRAAPRRPALSDRSWAAS